MRINRSRNPCGVWGRSLAVLMLAVLAGCATGPNTLNHCKVSDPELAQGRYAGGCADGLADGYGEVEGISSYRGSFMAGRKHGKGIKMMSNGDRYAGDFSDDYRHGKGVYVWGPNTPWHGDRYEGEYRRDLRHGWGVFQWNNGDRYEGAWQDDLRMGGSVMELRRAQAGEAAARSVKAGASVCTEARLGMANHQRIRGRVEHVSGEAVEVRIVEVEGGVASYRDKVVKAGDVFSDKAVNWQLCSQN